MSRHAIHSSIPRWIAVIIWLPFLLLAACQQQEEGRTAKSGSDTQLQRAREIAHRYVIVDTHIDVPYRLEDDWEDLTKRAERGNFDYARAKEGGLDGAFMSIYTPAELEWAGPGKAYAHAEKMIDHVEDLIRRAPDKFVLATRPDDVLAAHRAGKIALAMGMENGAPIEGKLENLKHFYDRGIRYITLAHSKSNHLADSSYDSERPNGGLSDFGRRVVKEMNALGILVDLSHLSDAAASEILRISPVPPIASHSSVRHFTPGFERNLSDKLIRAIARHNGVIMINFGSAFLTNAANEYGKKQREAYEAWLKETGSTDTPENKEAFDQRYRTEHPYPYATVEDVVRHINHIVGIAGLPYVGIGSDFDGVGDSLPIG
ncbi:MAG: membrane dipeptidase, partial [Alphaproteobacteria bacterium]